jgi:hypothetical protein
MTTKRAFNAILDANMERKTKELRSLPIPQVSRGQEIVCVHLVGSVVKMSSCSPYRGTAEIVAAANNNGYASYTAKIGKSTVYLRQKDIDLDWSIVYQNETARRQLFREFCTI